MVQGEGAQLASLLAEPKPGQKILDCCSAPGGKSTHMAALSHNEAKITALDVNASRLELVEQNARRLGVTSITTREADSTVYDDGNDYDIVLVDAPCSGLGIMGGKPDIRLTITYERIGQIIQKQKEILDNMSSLVKSGGVLLYSTCTINTAENEQQVQDFLARHDDFELYDFDNMLPESLKSRGSSGMITLLPDVDGCEGFFISRMRRK
jgi:tRNA and rRNA cytosine-C5-methylases